MNKTPSRRVSAAVHIEETTTGDASHSFFDMNGRRDSLEGVLYIVTPQADHMR